MTVEESIVLFTASGVISMLYCFRVASKTRNENTLIPFCMMGVIIGAILFTAFLVNVGNHTFILPYWNLVFLIPFITRLMLCNFSLSKYLEARATKEIKQLNKLIEDQCKEIKKQDKLIHTLELENKALNSRITNNPHSPIKLHL